MPGCGRWGWVDALLFDGFCYNITPFDNVVAVVANNRFGAISSGAMAHFQRTIIEKETQSARTCRILYGRDSFERNRACYIASEIRLRWNDAEFSHKCMHPMYLYGHGYAMHGQSQRSKCKLCLV